MAQKHIIEFNEWKDLLFQYSFEATDEIAGFTEYSVTLYVNGEVTFNETILAYDEDEVYDHAMKMYYDYFEYTKL
jgi:hypothetical protein